MHGISAVLVYGFKILVQDVNDSTVQLGVDVNNKAAEAMFGMTPFAFTCISANALRDGIENVQEVPVKLKMIVKYSKDSMDHYYTVYGYTEVTPA